MGSMRIVKVSEDEDFKLFMHDAIKDYESIITNVIDDINCSCKNESNFSLKKLEKLYQYFLSLNIEYAYHTLGNNGSALGVIGHYKTKNKGLEGDLGIAMGGKLAPILIHKGVCSSYSSTFCDMARRLGNNCAFIESDSINHAWNAILIDDKLKYLDLTPIIKSKRTDIPLKDALTDKCYSFNQISITTNKCDDNGSNISIIFNHDSNKKKCYEYEIINFLKTNKIVQIKNDSHNNNFDNPKEKKPAIKVRSMTDENCKTTYFDNDFINQDDLITGIINKINKKLGSIMGLNYETYKLYQLKYVVMYLKEEQNRLHLDNNFVYNNIFPKICDLLNIKNEILFSNEGQDVIQNLTR